MKLKDGITKVTRGLKSKLIRKEKKPKKKDVLRFIDKTIDEDLEKREDFNVGTKEYEKLTDEITKLTELRIEAEEMKTKNVLKRLDVITSTILDGSGLILKLVIFKAGMKFEEENVFTSSMFRNFWRWITRKERD